MARYLDTSMSRHMCRILRHEPGLIGGRIDQYGWASVNDIIDAVNKKFKNKLETKFDLEKLEEIVAKDNKGRYSFNEDKTKIRCNQGHSIKVDVEKQELEPPEFLFHGTCYKSVGPIFDKGILPMKRLYVQLSDDYDTAITVGKRHGSPTVFKVKTGDMYRDGYQFFLSPNKVWMTKNVPPQYLIHMD